MNKAHLLINTRSRSGGSSVAKLIVSSLEAEGIKVVEVHKLNHKTSFDEVLNTIVRHNPKLLIVASGDGTVSSVVDKLAGKAIEIGLIPLGTTNNLARSLNIPFDIPGAVRIISTKKARAIDLGAINGEYFTNVAGIGLSASIANNVQHAHKKTWGRLAYLYTAITSVLSQKAFRITIQDPDNELSITFETRQFIVANGRFHSGKEIAADTRINNGQLVLFALGSGSRLSLIRHTLDFYLGSRKKVAHASYFVGKSVTISTSSPQSIELDGEVRTKSPATVKVETAAIKVRY